MSAILVTRIGRQIVGGADGRGRRAEGYVLPRQRCRCGGRGNGALGGRRRRGIHAREILDLRIARRIFGGGTRGFGCGGGRPPTAFDRSAEGYPTREGGRCRRPCRPLPIRSVDPAGIRLLRLAAQGHRIKLLRWVPRSARYSWLPS